MPYYRLYFLDRRGHFIRHEERDLADDAAAHAEARRLDHADSIEIWQGKRKVGVVEPATRR